jgi:Predicted O-methyltransferase
MKQKRTPIKLLRKYIVYKLVAKHRKGFGIHSPFTFTLLNKTLREKVPKELIDGARSYRLVFMNSTAIIPRSTRGAGTLLLSGKDEGVLVKQIMKQSSISSKYGKLLYLLSKHFGSEGVLELGTGLGMSTFYLATGAKNSTVISIEGHQPYAQLAEQELDNANLENVEIINGLFEEGLEKIKKEKKQFGLFYIDGDHTLEATISNFNRCIDISTQNAIFIFDDIHWSSEMEQAWENIKQLDQCRISMDLFRLGIVFTNKKFLKQNYIVRY